MCSKRRTTVLLASAAALGVGLITFPTSAAANPPWMPNCTPKASSASDSCVRLWGRAVDGSMGPTLERIRLGVRVRSAFSPATDETRTVILRFDDKAALNFRGIPVCAPSEVVGKNIAQAWEQCGPGADGNPPSEGNAYLSMGVGPNVSGVASTVPFNGGAVACTMVFRGPNAEVAGPPNPNWTVTLYARAPVTNQFACNNPASNTAGSTTVIFRGFLSREAAGSPYDWRLRVPNTHTANPALDDFYATVVRGNAFRARCPSSSYLHKLVGIFDYTSTPTDVIAPPYPGTRDRCSTSNPP